MHSDFFRIGTEFSSRGFPLSQDKLDDGALQELTQMIGVTGMGKQSDIRDFEQACSLLRVAQESRSGRRTNAFKFNIQTLYSP